MPDWLFHSEVDSRRFGKRIFRAVVTDKETAEQLCNLIDPAIELVIVRCPAENISILQRLEQSGFFVCDTLVYYRARIDRIQSAEMNPDIHIRRYEGIETDGQRVAEIAKICFTDYPNHYYADPRLDKKSISEGYAEWALSFCTPSPRQGILLSVENDFVTGFLTYRKNDNSWGEIVLNAVDPMYQRKGIYEELCRAAAREVSQLGAIGIMVSTQLVNIAIQRVWRRLGFDLAESFYTLHRWY